jgi:hypothetical protein
VIETPEIVTNISLSKGSIKVGKNHFQGVETTIDIEETLESKRRKIKGKKILFPPKEVKVTKPKKPFTRSTTKKQNLVDENHVDEIPTDETFPSLETNYVVEYKPPSGAKVRFSLEVLDKEKIGRSITRSSTRKKIHVEETKCETHVHCVVEEVVEVQYPPEK